MPRKQAGAASPDGSELPKLPGLLRELNLLTLADGLDELLRNAERTQPSYTEIVTSNTTFRRWGPLFPSEAQAVATVERLSDRATILRFTGKGLRGPQEILGDKLDDDD